MMKKLSPLLAVLCLLAGCTSSFFRYVIVDTSTPSGGQYTEIAKLSDSRQSLSWQIDSKVEKTGTFRVKYHPLSATKHCIVVEGSIADNNKKYPVVLDTGASQGVFVNDIHVLENKLSIYPVQTNKADSADYGFGLCYVPELRIGQMTLLSFPCWYLQRHLEIEFFGLPIVRDESIIVGLKALQEFNYIIFDGTKREVVFSRDKDFEPDNEQLWSKYPLSIEEDQYGNVFLFVWIPIANELMKVQLDTGSGNGLALSEEQWGQLSHKIQKVKLKEDTELYPYIGRLPCKQGVITQLQVGRRLIRNAKISVFPANSPLLSDCNVVLGMQYFKDTVIVLDFNKEVLWIMKQAS